MYVEVAFMITCVKLVVSIDKACCH